jgi:hypothetical protein
MKISKLGKLPYFPFYPKDFLMSEKVMAMNFAERGQYITLLCWDWNNNGVAEELFNNTTESKLVRSCFEKQGDRLFNDRLNFEREKIQEFCEKQSEKGRASGKARLLKGKSAEPRLNRGSFPVEPKVNHTNSNSNTNTNSNTKEEKDLKETDIVRFQNIFDYWNEQSAVVKHRNFTGTIRGRITSAINGRITEGYTEQDILDAIKNYNEVLNNEGQFFKHKWALDIFLTRSGGFPNFTNEADPKNNWLKDKPENKNKETGETDNYQDLSNWKGGEFG